MPAPRRDALTALALAALALAVFGRTAGWDFVNFDDGTYVAANPHVLTGLTGANAARAFTTFDAANWHPLTWLSLQADATLFGVRPLGFHLTNVLLHAANAALLFLALRSLTGAFWRSAVAAALFAVHPLRAESVAWVSERKDVLSALFGFLALWAYAGYARNPSAGRYLAVAALLALSLLAKPMLVTLPCLLLVLDGWPLGRIESWRRLVAEKLPLFALAAASCAVTFVAQQRGGAVNSLEQVPLAGRLQNAAVAYADYLRLAAWPSGLAVYYPYPPDGWPASRVAVSVLVVAGLTALAVWQRQRRPYLLTGWLWYLGTLVPVIGLVQVGGQAYADRYTYLPLVGPAVALVWAGAEVAGAARARTALAAAGVVVAWLATLSWIQTDFWRDGFALWKRDLEAVGSNEKALNNLGELLLREGRIAEATGCLGEAVRRRPEFAAARCNLGGALTRAGKFEEARRQLDAALRLDPRLYMTPLNLGVLLFEQKKYDEAVGWFEEALALRPDSAVARAKLGTTLWVLCRDDEALARLTEAVRLGPNEASARYALGQARSDQGRYAEAAAELDAAVRLQPRNVAYRLALAAALDRAGGDAGPLVRAIAAGDPRWAEGVAREARSAAEHPDATPRDGRHAAELIRLACKFSGGNDPRLYDALAAAYARAGLLPEAVAAAEKAVASADAARQPELARAAAGRLALYRERRSAAPTGPR